MRVYNLRITSSFQLNIKKFFKYFKRSKSRKSNDFFYPEEKIRYLKSLDRNNRWPPY
jgi:hypothetical protein